MSFLGRIRVGPNAGLLAAVGIALVLASAACGQQAQTSNLDRRWVGNTDGPLYTGTANVEPRSSFHLQTTYSNALTKGVNSISAPFEFVYGIGHGLDFSIIGPFVRNAVEYPKAPPGIHAGDAGYGDTQVSVKWQWATGHDRYHFWTLPYMSFAFLLNIPTGKYSSLRPDKYGTDQFGNGTWNEKFSFELHKQFKPFELYLQESDIVHNPVRVTGPYGFNNGINILPPGQKLHVVDGNVLYSSGAFEHVLIPKHGFGYLLEYAAERQFDRSLIFGKATAPAYSYLKLVPELEVTWPNKEPFPVTWAVGSTFTAARSNYPAYWTPVFTVFLFGDIDGMR